jgi:hypothetical protein
MFGVAGCIRLLVEGDVESNGLTVDSGELENLVSGSNGARVFMVGFSALAPLPLFCSTKKDAVPIRASSHKILRSHLTRLLYVPVEGSESLSVFMLIV